MQKPSYRVIMVVKILKQCKYFQIEDGLNYGSFSNGIYEDTWILHMKTVEKWLR